MNDIEVHNPPAENPEESMTRALDSKPDTAEKNTIILVMLKNQHDRVKTDFGYTYIQMGQRLWRSLLNEVNYVLDRYEEQVLDYVPPSALWMYTAPDAVELRCARLVMVESGRVAALQERLVQLVTRVPYRLQESDLVVLRVSA